MIEIGCDIDQVAKNQHHINNNIDPLSPWAWILFPFIYICFDFFH